MGSNLNKMFTRMGARLRVPGVDPSFRRFRAGVPSRTEVSNIAIEIGQDKSGEFFEIRTVRDGKQELDVLHVIPEEKHLVLLSRQFDKHGELLAKQKFLCGRDEKHWFVAAIPESEPVSTVAGARIALKPEAVRKRELAVEFPARKASGEGTPLTCGKENGFSSPKRM